MQLYPGGAFGTSFVTSNAADAPTNTDATPTGSLIHNGVVDGSVTVSIVAISGYTGGYYASATIPSGYAVGDKVSVLVSATINGAPIGDEVLNEVLVSSQATLVAAIAAAILVTPVHLIATDASGDVTLTSAQAAELVTAAGYTIPTTAQIATAVAAPSAATIAAAVAAPSASTIATAVAAPSASTIAAAILAVPANKLTTDANGAVPLQTADETKLTTAAGYTVPTTSQIATAILTTPANKIATDASGNVTLVTAQATELATAAAIAPPSASAIATAVAAPSAATIAAAVAAPTASAIAAVVAAPSAATIAAAILTTPSNKLTTDANGAPPLQTAAASELALLATVNSNVTAIEATTAATYADVVTIGDEVAALPSAATVAAAVAAPSAQTIATAVGAPSAATIAAAVWGTVQSALTTTGSIGYNLRRIIQGFLGTNAETYVGSAPVTAVEIVVKAEDGATTLDVYTIELGANGPTSRTVS
jgi:hypothetical protein